MKSKHKITKSLGSAYHAGWVQTNKDRVEFYLTILNDLAEDIEIPGRLTRANLVEVLGWLSKEQSNQVAHMSDIHGKLMLLAADSLVSAMKEGLFKDARVPKTKQPERIAKHIAQIIEQCGLINGVDKEILCYHISKAVLSTQHEQQQRPSVVGGTNPVEAAIDPVQQPARA
jgi:hypothetical protein